MKIKLPNVTLFGIDGYNPEGLIYAANHCIYLIDFGSVNIITENVPFNTKQGYSRYCLEEMAGQINTSHTLVIQADGFVQNADSWNDDWLNYDYIGATWDWKNENIVGNGGFSLRSKKLLDILAKVDYSKLDYHPEDEVICHNLRKWLENEFDIKFAPVEVAKKFSIEGFGLKPELARYNNEFGFHGHSVYGLKKQPLIKKTWRY